MAANKIKGLTIAINGETTGLDNALSGVNRKTKDLQGELKEVERLLKMDPGNTELLGQKQELLAKSVSNTAEKLATLKTAAEQAQEQLDRGEISGEQFRALQREVVKAEQELSKLNERAKEFGTVFEQRMKQAGASLGEFGDKVGKVGAGLSKGVTAPLVAVGAASSLAFKEVDTAMDSIATATGATGKDLDALQDSFRAVYGAIPTDAAAAGAAIGEVNTQFALTGDALAEASEKLLKFSQINGQDVVGATQGAKGAMEAFGLSAQDLDSVLDSITRSAQNSGVSTGKLLEEVTRGAPQLRALGLDVAQSAELMGSLAQKGIEGSKALSLLARAQVGFAKDGKSMAEGLEDLTAKIAGTNSETEALAIAAEVFGTKGASFMLDAINRGALEFEDFANAATLATGAVADTFEATLDPVDQVAIAMNNLKMVGADLSATMQTVLAPILEILVEKARAFSEWFKNLDPQVQEFIVKAGVLAAAAGPILVVARKLIGLGGDLLGVLGKVGPAIGGIGKALSFLAANPVVLVVAAVAGLVAWLMHLWKTNENFREGVIAIWAEIKSTVERVVGSLKKFFTKDIPDAISKASERFKELPGEIFSIGADMIAGLWDGIVSKAVWVKDKVAGFINGIKRAFTDKEGFDIQSPSKWAEGVGENVTEGFADGIVYGIDAVEAALAELVHTTKRAFEGIEYEVATDYQAMINEAVAAGDLAMAAQLERTRNAKISGEGLDGKWAKTFNFDAFLASIEELPEQIEFAVSSPPAASESNQEDLLKLVADAVGTALLAGLEAVGANIFDALPKEVILRIRERELARASWEAFDTEGRSRTRIYAPSREEIMSIARSAVPQGG